MGDFSPIPGGRAGISPTQIFVAGNTTGETTSSTARSLSLSGAGIATVGLSSGSIIFSVSSAASGTVRNVFASGNTTGLSSSTSETLSANSYSGAGIVSIGFTTSGAGAGMMIISATTAAQTVQTIGGLATGNTTGSSSSTTFDARSVTVSGAGIVSVGYSSNNILIVSATTAAQTVQTIGGFASGNTTGSSSSTTFDARSLTVSGAGDISVGYSSNNILIISHTAPVASGTVVNMSMIGNTTAQSSSSSQTLTAVSFSGAGGISLGMSTTAAGSPVMVISGPLASGTIRNVFASGNTTGQSSSTTETLSVNSYSGAGIVSIGFTTSGAGAGMMIISATTAAQTVQTIGGFASGNTTGSSSSTTFDARSVTVSGAGDISVGYSSNNILIISGTAPVASGTVVNMSMIGNTTAQSSSSSQTLTAVSFSGAGGISVGMSTTAAGSPVMVISGPLASGTVLNVFASGNTTGQSSSTTETLSNVSYSGAGIVSVGFTTSGAGAGMMVISATTVAQTVQTIGGFASGNTTGSSSSTTFDARSVTVSGAGIVSVGYSSNNILIVSATTAASQGGLSFNAIGNTTGLTTSSASSIPETLTLSGAGGVSLGFSNSTIVISAPASSTVNNLFALGNTTGQSSSTTVTLTNLSFSGAGVASIGYSTTGAGAGVVIVSVPTGVGTSSGGVTLTGNTTVTSSFVQTFSSQLISGAGGITVGFSSSSLIISQNNTSSFLAIGANTAVAGTTTSMTAANSLSFSGKNDIDVAFNAGTIVIANEFVSFFEPMPFLGSSLTTSVPVGTMMVAPFVVPSAISFNQMRLLVSRTAVAASLTQSTAAAASTTATASAGWNSTVSVVIYSRQGGTSSQSFSSLTSTTVTYGVTQNWSISRTAASNSVTATLSFGWAQGTVATNTSTFTTSASAAATSVYTFGFTGASLFTNASTQLIRFDVPFLASIPNGAYLVGIMGSSASAIATGNSLNTVAAGSLSQQFVAITQGASGVTAIFVPGTLTSNFFPGVGSTSSAGSVPPTTIGWQALSTASLNYQPYFHVGVL